ncbi:hypothetical protein AWB90_07045 [Mycobacterium paraense]|uniref:PE domain-containing protein n=1 Tax=Mycobacterium paraense TaxID=767916 RepID=A0A1X2AG75_9MYCO|nr:PE family protein [Mycobacterium paraense]ORW50296.1 hypothetical protein AWB90_07045 [Mycobacterium paraense]
MSYLVAVPDLVQGAAQELVGIRSSLGEAAAAAAAPTTGIVAAAQDEVSMAVASLFGDLGGRFQALSAQAQAFHAEFVRLLTAGADAYLGTEAANAAAAAAAPAAIPTGGQIISQAVTGFESQLAALAAGGAPGLINSVNAFGASVAAPYQALVANTATNLQAIGNTVVSNPFPFVHQLVNNQIFYGETIAATIGTGIQNLPAELANLPVTVQAGLQGLASFNPGGLLQQFVNNQIGYAQTVFTGLAAAPQDFVTGLTALPASFQAAGQALLAGDPVAAANALGQGVESVFLPGFNVANPAPGVVTITPAGPLGDLLPILSIPGQMAQNFTNLLPASSIPGMVAQNFTNVIKTVTSTANTLDIIAGTLTFGMPLEVIFDGIGAPINALSALNSSAAAFGAALQTGNVGAAVAAVLDAPAVVANGFLNGTTVLPLPLVSLASLGAPGVFSLVEIPFGGILTPLSLPPLFLVADGVSQQLTLSGGTGFGGLIPGMLNIESELAQAIALPPPVLPAFPF